MDEEIEGIEPVSGVSKKKKISKSSSSESKSKVFKTSLEKVEEKKAAQEVSPEKTGEKVSPMDLMAQKEKVSPENLQDFSKKIHEANNSVEKLKNQLHVYEDTPIPQNALIRSSISKTLDHIDHDLQLAHQKVGIETTTTISNKPSDISKPIKHFLSSLTKTQEAMNKLPNELMNMGKDLTVGAMFGIQLHVNNIQQTIEFFSSALSKALEMTKTILSVQV